MVIKDKKIKVGAFYYYVNTKTIIKILHVYNKQSVRALIHYSDGKVNAVGVKGAVHISRIGEEVEKQITLFL